MNEIEAQHWIRENFGSVGEARMTRLAQIVTAESARQNLVAPSTLDALWNRHIVDSAQLVRFAETGEGTWLDIGTGAGFPGMVVAALTDWHMILVEPRRRRAEFLRSIADELELSARVEVVAGKVETVSQPAAIISARAVASLNSLFGSAAQCSRRSTRWILPKGRSAREEVAAAQQTWHGVFHVEQSITDPESLIVLAKGVSRR